MEIHETIDAVFEQRTQAEGAIDELVHAGIAPKQIGIAAPGHKLTEAHTHTQELEATAAQGAVVGSMAGGATGALAGVMLSALVPGIGQVLVGGLLTNLLVAAATGAAVGAYIGPFVALELSKEKLEVYRQELGEGRTLVVVKAPGRSAEVAWILRQHGGRPVESHVAAGLDA